MLPIFEPKLLKNYIYIYCRPKYRQKIKSGFHYIKGGHKNTNQNTFKIRYCGSNGSDSTDQNVNY